MAGGYFNDGAGVNVELGEYVPALPTVARRNLILTPYDLPAEILPSGGGLQEIEALGQRLRANLGDAERYVYGLFRQLARSGPGDLGVEDNIGRRATFADAVCVGARAEIQAFRFVDARFTFLAPERSGQPVWGAIPLAPAVYPGGSTSQDYAAGGITIGEHPAAMRIEMVRSCELRPIPRARGGRATVPHARAHLRFIVESHQVSDTDNLADELQDLARSIGPGEVNLTGNGITYIDCVLEGIRPDFTDNRATRFEAEFVKEI